MYIYSAAITALLGVVFGLQASAQSLPGVVVDHYHHQHRRADRIIRLDAASIQGRRFRRAPTVIATITAATSTINSRSPSSGASPFDPAILNHELYRAGEVLEALSPSDAAAPATKQSTKASQVDPETWDTQTKAACETALLKLQGRASNPSGMAICYNLPVLDRSTGVFKADMRLYRVSAPAPGWSTLMDQTVSLGLYYPEATVAVQTTPKMKRGSLNRSEQGIEAISAVELDKRADDVMALQMLQSVNLVGQINGDKMDEMAKE